MKELEVKVNYSTIIEGLEDLIRDRKSFIDKTDDECAFTHDKVILQAAIDMLEKISSENRELVEEIKKTRQAIKNGVEFGYIDNCKCTDNWLERVEKLLEKSKGVEL